MKQNHKIYTLVIFIVSLLVFAWSIVFWNLTAAPCSSAPTSYCGLDDFEQTFYPFLVSFIALLPITIILFFVRRETFMGWAKFAGIAFPLMFGGLFYAFRTTRPTGGWVGGPNEAQIASFLLPGLFIIISLVIIAMKSAGPEKK